MDNYYFIFLPIDKNPHTLIFTIAILTKGYYTKEQ